MKPFGWKLEWVKKLYGCHNSRWQELFDKDRTVIGRHIRNIYKEGELVQDITCAKFAHMGKEGDQPYEYTAYNLDVIISVGYRVKSKRGTLFR